MRFAKTCICEWTVRIEDVHQKLGGAEEGDPHQEYVATSTVQVLWKLREAMDGDGCNDEENFYKIAAREEARGALWSLHNQSQAGALIGIVQRISSQASFTALRNW